MGPSFDHTPASFHAIGTYPEEFSRIFSGELLDEFFRTAVTVPHELNVTPSSVNICTTYAGFDVQRRNVAFLTKLAAHLEQT